MKKQIRQSSIANTAIVLLSGVMLTGCVASAIDTPQGFVSTLEQPTTSDVLSLSEAGDLPKPDGRPNPTTQIAATDPASAAVETAATVAPTPPVAIAATETPLSESDVANQRILAAENAPTANGASAPIIVAAAAPIASAEKPRQTGLLSALFGNSDRKPPAPVGKATSKTVAVASAATPTPKRVVSIARASGSTSSLPGVSRDRALGVSSSNEDVTKPIQVASAAGLARLTPNGIATQHAGVDVKCLKPALVRVLKTVERKFGKPVVVTSGYRSPARNKKARGAKNSLHIYCAAADIQVEGVSKWTLAKYLRSLPGRGGVGTYCHTKSVHVDIGPNRDWNWRCRRKK